MPKILEMEINLEVFQTGNARAWVHDLLLDHRTRSLEHAVETLRAVLALPFNARLRERFGNLDDALEFAPSGAARRGVTV